MNPYTIGAMVPFTISREDSATAPTARVKKAGTEEYIDFADNVWKTSGWTTQTVSLLPAGINWNYEWNTTGLGASDINAVIVYDVEGDIYLDELPLKSAAGGAVTVEAFTDGAKDFFRPLLTASFLSTEGWKPDAFDVSIDPPLPVGVTITLLNKVIGDYSGTFAAFDNITLGVLSSTGWTVDAGWTDPLYQGGLEGIVAGTDLADYDGGTLTITVCRKSAGTDPQTITVNLLPTDVNDGFYVRTDGTVTRTKNYAIGSQAPASGGGSSAEILAIKAVTDKLDTMVEDVSGYRFKAFATNAEAIRMEMDANSVKLSQILTKTTRLPDSITYNADGTYDTINYDDGRTMIFYYLTNRLYAVEEVTTP